MFTSGTPPPNYWLLFTLGGAGFLLEFPIVIKVNKNNNISIHLAMRAFGSALPEQYPIKGFQLTLYPLFLPLGRCRQPPNFPLFAFPSYWQWWPLTGVMLTLGLP